jgi:PAS domain-containing protein
MKKSKVMRGLSDMELLSVIESLPEGMALIDAAGRPVWANRLARRLLTLRATTSPADDVGTQLDFLIARLSAAMPPFRSEECGRWTVKGGGVVDVTLRRVWGSQVALRMLASPDLLRAAQADRAATEPSSWQLIVAERMLEESVVGLVVANEAGGIDWMNPQAHRMLGGGARHVGRDAQRDVARAARHVASCRLLGPIRMNVELPTRTVEALFWNIGPGLAGVLFEDDVEEMRAPFGRERLIA